MEEASFQTPCFAKCTFSKQHPIAMQFKEIGGKEKKKKYIQEEFHVTTMHSLPDYFVKQLIGCNYYKNA